MMKPCYLNGCWRSLAVRLDGAALSITQTHRAQQFIPLSRISRLVVSGNADISVPALLACAERGISITFLQADGTLRGFLFGAKTSHRQSLWQAIQDFLDRPDWPEHYLNWRRAVGSRAHRALCLRLQQPADRCRAQDLAVEFERWQIARLGVRQQQFIERRLQGLCIALAAAVLAESGVQADAMSRIHSKLDLAADLGDCLWRDLWLPWSEYLSQQAYGQAITDQALVAFFESRSPRLQRLANQIIRRLHDFLLEL